MPQVRPVEGAHQHCRILQPQVMGDVLAHPRGGGGGVGVEGDAAEGVLQPAKFLVLGSEIVSPHADAMRLVEALHEHALRGGVEQLQLALAGAGQRVAPLGGAQAAVNARGRHATLGQRIDLVLHQGDQRGNHDGHTGHGHGRRLVAERLAPARRQHDDRVLPPQHCLHRLPLERQEGIIAPVLLQNMSYALHRPIRFCRHVSRHVTSNTGRAPNRRPLD